MSTDQEYWDACLIKTWRNHGNFLDAVRMFTSITGRLVFGREEPLLRLPRIGLPLTMRVRPYMAQHLEKISRRLWDQTPDKDVALLRALKDSKYDTTHQATNPDRELATEMKRTYTNKKRVAMNALQRSVRNQATDWGVTKGAVRTKMRRK